MRATRSQDLFLSRDREGAVQREYVIVIPDVCPKEPRKNNFTLSLGVDVAQALVPAGSRLFSTAAGSLAKRRDESRRRRLRGYATSVAVKLFLTGDQAGIQTAGIMEIDYCRAPHDFW
jgi:hypothetical protein